MGAKVIIFDKILNSTFLKGLRHSAMMEKTLTKSALDLLLTLFTVTYDLIYS